MSSLPPKGPGAALGSSSGNRAPQTPLELFLELADLFEQRGEPKMRDRFVILAADAACTAGQTQEAERLLQRLLSVSPHHLLKAYRSFAEALAAEPFRTYLNDLKQNYPLADAEKLLHSLKGTTASGSRVLSSPGLSGATPAPAPASASSATARSSASAPVDLANEPTAPFPGVPAKAGDVEDDQTVTMPVKPPRASVPAAKPAAKPAARPVQPASSSAAPSQSRSRAPVAQPASAPRTKPPPAAPLQPAEPESTGSSFLPTLLFLVVFLAGLALMGYSLARPFLP